MSISRSIFEEERGKTIFVLFCSFFSRKNAVFARISWNETAVRLKVHLHVRQNCPFLKFVAYSVFKFQREKKARNCSIEFKDSFTCLISLWGFIICPGL